MNLFCEEVHKLEAEFKQCRKLLNAIGDENRQHLICVMMNMPIDGGLVLEIVEQTHHPGCHSLITIPFVENIVAALPIIMLPSSLIALVAIESSSATGIPIIIFDAT